MLLNRSFGRTLFLLDKGEQGSPGDTPPPSDDPGDQPPPKDKGEEQDDSAGPDLNSLDPKLQTYIKSLRKESAGYRTQLNQMKTWQENIQNGLQKMFGQEGGDDVPPEEQLYQLQAGWESAALENAILRQAVEFGIPKDGMEFFEFLVQKRMSDLEEGEELGAEDLEELAAKARDKFSAQQGAGTSVGGRSNPPPPNDGSSDVTVEQFGKMSVSQKSELYQKKPDRYNELFAEWKKRI